MSDSPPRVTLALPTYNRDRYLAEALESCRIQDYDGPMEILVVVDGEGTPAIDRVLSEFDDPRLRVVRHERNRGIAAAMNTIMAEARGELVATMGDDDVNYADRIRRQVAVFDRYPDTGVVHGDAMIIDEHGGQVAKCSTPDPGRTAMLQCLVRYHNLILDPTTMRHRRVFEAIGPCEEDLGWEDFSFHMRALRSFRYRHVGGHPLLAYRRHGENTSDSGDQRKEIAMVERVLWEALDLYELSDLVPELDWEVIGRADGERQALEILADAFANRALPLPGLAGRVRERARALSRPVARAAPSRGRIVMTSYGYANSGGGTQVPRLVSKELVRRGWDVTVFAAGVEQTDGPLYDVREQEVDGVHLVSVHNRPHTMLDLGNPRREIDDPPITAAFAGLLDRVQPDVVHFHNLHNLGAALVDQAAARGLPSYFSTHNYWLICPRAYLLTGAGAMCSGPGDHGANCASCVGSHDAEGHVDRLAEIRGRFTRGVNVCMAVSDAVKRTLVAQGYPEEATDVVRQAMPAAERIWDEVGRDRTPGPVGQPLTVAFFGSALWHKGPQLLVKAAQRTRATLRVQIHGEIPDSVAGDLKRLDKRGVVDATGAFHPGDLPELLAGVDVAVMPSLWWDCAPLMAAECLAARVPLVAPRLGGLPEAVRHEIDGLLFDGLDADGLAAALDRLVEEDGLLERLQAGIEAPRPFAEYVDELEAYYAGARPSRAVAPSAPAVRWVGDHDRPTSLSTINRRVGERLGLELERVARDGSLVSAPLAHTAEVEVRHQWPPDFSPSTAGRLAVIQPWEFGAVPRDWVEQIQGGVDALWVPSEYVRSMYVESGVDADRVHVVPNGVDPDAFAPEGELLELDAPGTRFLFVGGLIARKGHDTLLAAWREAFAGRDDVTLVVKDFGADGVYGASDRSELIDHARSGALPRILYLDDELSDRQMPALYRACDVLVHPYRGEGFAMPVLEAMACGLPVIVTAGGPTDEFCPDDACWRIPSQRRELAACEVAGMPTAGHPWMLEPDPAALVELLRSAAGDADGRNARGVAGVTAAAALSWDAVAARYRDRIEALTRRPALPGPEPEGELELSPDADVHVLAAPAWGASRPGLDAALAAWVAATEPGQRTCLYLLTGDDDAQSSLEQTAAAADAAGVDLDAGADITVLAAPFGPDDLDHLYRAMDAYVALPGAAPGHERGVRAAGVPAVPPGELYRLPLPPTAAPLDRR